MNHAEPTGEIDKNIFEVFGQIDRETKEAIMLRTGVRSMWLPKSQIVWNGKKDLYRCATIGMPEWLAKKKGII